jgi:hypothetical protein
MLLVVFVESAVITSVVDAEAGRAGDVFADAAFACGVEALHVVVGSTHLAEVECTDDGLPTHSDSSSASLSASSSDSVTICPSAICSMNIAVRFSALSSGTASMTSWL